MLHSSAIKKQNNENTRKEEEKKVRETKNSREKTQLDFLKQNATQIIRTTKKPDYFHETNREMNGKFGWFCSYGKSYNMTEYFSGWEFQTEELYKEFQKI